MGKHGGLWAHLDTRRDPKKLIERAVDAARHGDAPPPDLKLAWWCERYNCLPDAGGMHDQDYALIYRMNTLNNVYNTAQRVANMKGAEIHKLTQSELRLIAFLRKEGLW